jgi:alpha-1,3-mannosyltransferase
MRIIHVIRQYKPSVGGLEDATHNLCTYLNRIDGCQASIVTLNRVFTNPELILPSHEEVDGIDVTRIPFSGSSRYPLAPSVLKHINDADIVHVHAVDFFFDFLSLFRFVHRKPLVASTHGGFFHTSFAARLKRIYFNTITRFSCSGYKTICASSDNDAKTFRAISPSNIITIENGVNVKKWADAGSKTSEKKLIFIGRWSANKQTTQLIRLIHALKAKGNDWQLIIAGLPADDTVVTLQTLATQLNVSNLVKIVSSPSEAEIKALISTASYITSASNYEGFGISIIEGLSAGLYPVVTPLAPFKKLTDALGLGVHIDVDNLNKTAHQLEQAHAYLKGNIDEVRRRCMELSSQYAWDGVAQKFYDVYKAVLQ